MQHDDDDDDDRTGSLSRWLSDGLILDVSDFVARLPSAPPRRAGMRSCGWTAGGRMQRLPRDATQLARRRGWQSAFQRHGQRCRIVPAADSPLACTVPELLRSASWAYRLRHGRRLHSAGVREVPWSARQRCPEPGQSRRITCLGRTQQRPTNTAGGGRPRLRRERGQIHDLAKTLPSLVRSQMSFVPFRLDDAVGSVHCCFRARIDVLTEPGFSFFFFLFSFFFFPALLPPSRPFFRPFFTAAMQVGYPSG